MAFFRCVLKEREIGKMQSDTCKLYAFLTACGGNWRNTVYISAQDGGNGWLMAADCRGCPVIMPETVLCRAAGRQIDPDECRGQMSEGAFRDIFARYLLWQLPSADAPLSQLEQQYTLIRR